MCRLARQRNPTSQGRHLLLIAEFERLRQHKALLREGLWV